MDRRAGFGSLSWDRLMMGLDQLIDGFEMVDPLIDGWIIGSSDGGSGDDFWVFSTTWVSNRRHGFVDRWLGFADRWLGWWVW